MEPKVKKCIRCRNNFTGDGTLCSFCLQKARDLEQQLQEANRHPESTLVRCTIERDGPTTVNFGQVRYVFEQNEHGHYVCSVTNLGHYEQLLRTPFYEAYVAPVVTPVEEVTEEPAPAPVVDPEQTTAAEADQEETTEVEQLVTTTEESPVGTSAEPEQPPVTGDDKAEATEEPAPAPVVEEVGSETQGAADLDQKLPESGAAGGLFEEETVVTKTPSNGRRGNRK